MFNVIKFFEDHKIEYHTEGHKHTRPGWVQISCPFCTGNPGYHLGFCIDSNSQYYNRFVCWRCGGKSLFNAIKGLIRSTDSETKNIMGKYGTGTNRLNLPILRPNLKRKNRRTCQFPTGTGKLTERHKQYLENRNYDPDKLEQIWNLQGTGPVGYYKFRIIAPIYFKEKLVSYQGRDITGKSKLKYKACAKEDEAQDHKECLYGLDLVPEKIVVVVEGITDVWRLGPGTVATFGVKFTLAQVKLLTQFDKIFLLYDSSNDDPQAIIQAEKLEVQLLVHGKNVIIYELDKGDPGDMDQNDADKLMKELMR